MEGNNRKTANHYGGIQYASSYSNGRTAASLYNNNCSSTITYGGFLQHQQQQQQLQLQHQQQQQQQLHEDYRPIYFYVAQPYTIPYTFAKRPRPNTSLLRSDNSRSNCRVKFSKKLANVDFSQKVKQGEFSKSLNQVHFAEAQDHQGVNLLLFILFFRLNSIKS